MNGVQSGMEYTVELSTEWNGVRMQWNDTTVKEVSLS